MRSSVAAGACALVLSSSAARAEPPPAPSCAPIELRDIDYHSLHRWRVHEAVPFQNAVRLDEPELYHILGREDLEQVAATRRRRKTAFAVGGLAAFVGGFAAMLWVAAPACSQQQKMDGTCPPPPSGGVRGKAGAAMFFLLAPSLFIASIRIDLEPVPIAEKRRIVDEYNASLESGGTYKHRAPHVAPKPRAPPEPAHRTIVLGPLLARQGGGLSLGVTF